jgi:hypothetical protein
MVSIWSCNDKQTGKTCKRENLRRQMNEAELVVQSPETAKKAMFNTEIFKDNGLFTWWENKNKINESEDEEIDGNSGEAEGGIDGEVGGEDGGNGVEIGSDAAPADGQKDTHMEEDNEN